MQPPPHHLMLTTHAPTALWIARSLEEFEQIRRQLHDGAAAMRKVEAEAEAERDRPKMYILGTILSIIHDTTNDVGTSSLNYSPNATGDTIEHELGSDAQQDDIANSEAGAGAFDSYIDPPEFQNPWW
ncbi:hypothetical protein BU15DRAFT_62115 [Melanogaster broomeanus]|nr:hypothetical protein BU15DRAFT_62115 [Melanogaster broomeanus]